MLLGPVLGASGECDQAGLCTSSRVHRMASSVVEMAVLLCSCSLVVIHEVLPALMLSRLVVLALAAAVVLLDRVVMHHEYCVLACPYAQPVVLMLVLLLPLFVREMPKWCSLELVVIEVKHGVKSLWN